MEERAPEMAVGGENERSALDVGQMGNGGGEAGQSVGAVEGRVVSVQGDTPMSKTQMKKAAKRLEQAGRRKDQRAKDKLKRKAKSEALRAEREREREAMAPEELERRRAEIREAREAQGAATREINGSMVRAARREDPTAKLVIDFWADLDTLMTGKELKSMGKQVLFSYSALRKATVSPLGLVLTGLGEVPKLEAVLKRNSGYLSWAVGREKEAFKDVFKDGVEEGRTRLVYLTADSPNVLDAVEDGVCYIIGGLVDRNRHRNITLDRARVLGVSTARLPLDEAHVKMNGNKHLTVVAVVEALQAKYDNPERPWSEIFVDSIAERRIQAAPGEEQQAEEGRNSSAVGGEAQSSAAVAAPPKVPCRVRSLTPAHEYAPTLVPDGPVSTSLVRIAFPTGFRIKNSAAPPEGGPSHAERIGRISAEVLATVGSVFGEVSRAVFPDTSPDLPSGAPACGLLIFSDPGAAEKAMVETGAAVCVQGVHGVVCAVGSGSAADLAYGLKNAPA